MDSIFYKQPLKTETATLRKWLADQETDEHKALVKECNKHRDDRAKVKAALDAAYATLRELLQSQTQVFGQHPVKLEAAKLEGELAVYEQRLSSARSALIEYATKWKPKFDKSIRPLTDAAIPELEKALAIIEAASAMQELEVDFRLANNLVNPTLSVFAANNRPALLPLHDIGKRLSQFLANRTKRK